MDILISLDESILYFISTSLKNVVFDIAMPIMSAINNNGEVWLLIALMFCLSSNKRIRLTGLTMLIALALGALAGEVILKNIISRARPIYNHNLLIPTPSGFSFPSGHTLSSFAAAGVMWIMKNKYKYVAFVLAFFIAFSRIYLHVHYPSDVVGGVLIGLICAIVSTWIVNMIISFKNKKY